MSLSLAPLVLQLRDCARRYARAHDSRAVFSDAYADLTQQLDRELHAFRDPQWVYELAIAFAARYTDALVAADTGQVVSPGWQPVFQAMRAHRTSVLEDLVLPMYAHIVHDLPLVLGTMPPPTETNLADFQAMNTVLGHSIGRIQNDTSRRYCLFLHWLDVFGQRQDEIATDYGIRLARAAAWYNAERLRSPLTGPDAQAALGRSTQAFVLQVLHPEPSPVALAFRVLRMLSSWSRRWPSR